MQLTNKQKEEIRDTAIEMAYEDAQQNTDYLYSIIKSWINGMPLAKQLLTISSDPVAYFGHLSFDPRTGNPWSEEDWWKCL